MIEHHTRNVKLVMQPRCENMRNGYGCACDPSLPRAKRCHRIAVLVTPRESGIFRRRPS